MIKSESTIEIFTALTKAQGEFTSVAFDKKNPHFNSKYASLSATQDMYRPVLQKHGLGLIQSITVQGEDYFLETILIHTSGQFLSDHLKLFLDKKNMQGLGSAITYAKRYAAQAILGICGDEDDDGNGASKDKGEGKESKPQNVPRKPPENKQPLAKPESRVVPIANNNLAPANASQYTLIETLLDQRGIPGGDLDFLVTEGYGARPDQLPKWIANEIIILLGDQNCDQGRIVEKTTEVRARRLAAQGNKT